MTNPNDPAFTGPTDKGFTPGLTKREYFASIAMQGLMHFGSLTANQIAETAVEQADALINRLNKPQ